MIATSGFLAALECQIRFRLGLCPRPCWGPYSVPHTS